MHNADKILFDKNLNSKLNKCSDVLFNTSIDSDIDSVELDVSHFFLKEDKTLNDGNIISSKELLIGVGYCKNTDMINLCSVDEETRKYFWAKSDEVNFEGTNLENWNVEDVSIHVKSIKEKWTKHNKKGLVTQKDIEKELQKMIK